MIDNDTNLPRQLTALEACAAAHVGNRHTTKMRPLAEFCSSASPYPPEAIVARADSAKGEVSLSFL